MQKLSFNQSKVEIIVRAASTLIFGALKRADVPVATVSEICERPQYGFTASAAKEPIGPRFVRITDLQNGKIDWDHVPFCACPNPDQYLLHSNDILFARTGATTGKTHIVETAPPRSVFASYLIRLRASDRVTPQYLYWFFQSDLYWGQIIDEKKGSAQPNVNGQKLSRLQLPLADDNVQNAVARFLEIVRGFQYGKAEDLPALPHPLQNVSRTVARIEEFAAKIEEARSLRSEVKAEVQALAQSALRMSVHTLLERVGSRRVEGLIKEAGYGTSVKCGHDRLEGAVPVLRIPNVASEQVNFEDLKFGVLGGAELERVQVVPEDILIVRTNGSLDLVGRCAVVPPLKEPTAFASYMIRIRCDRDTVLPEYLQLVLKHLRTDGHLINFARTTAGQYNVSLGRLRGAEVPVPCLAEQQRLVCMMAEMEVRLARLRLVQDETATELDALMPSILAEAFSGEL